VIGEVVNVTSETRGRASDVGRRSTSAITIEWETDEEDDEIPKRSE
jgi:hypothetical protein